MGIVDYATIANFASIMMAVLFLLVAGVNIIVEILKVFFKKIPTNYLAVVVSIIVALLAFFAWVTIVGIQIQWYHIVAAVMLGFTVAYGAMFGYDKLIGYWKKLKEIKNDKNQEE